LGLAGIYRTEGLAAFTMADAAEVVDLQSGRNSALFRAAPDAYLAIAVLGRLLAMDGEHQPVVAELGIRVSVWATRWDWPIAADTRLAHNGFGRHA
jgi:hypothetical protein